VALLLILSSTCVRAFGIVDDQGDRIEFSAPVERVVSLEPALSEMICALERCSVLVGVDRYSNWPLSLEKLPKVGGGIDPNVEQIYRLKPQVILSSRSALMKKKLGFMGGKVLEFDMTCLDDIHRMMLTLAPLLGVPLDQAQGAWTQVQEGLAQAARSVSPKAMGQRVYFEVSSDYFAASQSSFLGELMDRVGLRNVLVGDWGPFPRLNPEYILAQNPQLIMLGHQEASDLSMRAAWRDIDAVKNKRVCHFEAEQFDVLSRPGPRVVQAMQLMVKCINAAYPS
jgi:iron complex transport system substrate-binding protein